MKRTTAKRTITTALGLLSLPALVAAQTIDFAWIVSPSEPGTVSVVDATANRFQQNLSVTGAPYAVALSPDGATAYVAKSNRNPCYPCTTSDRTAPACALGTVSVIDAASRSEIASIPVDLLPVGIAVTPDGTRAYVANVCSGTKVSVIDAATRTVTATVQTTGVAPSRIAITPDGQRAYITHHVSNSVVVVATSTNAVIATIPVGGCPWGIGVTPDGSRVYVANSGPPGVVNQPPGCTIFTGTGSVSVIDTATNEVAKTIDGLSLPGWFSNVAISPDGQAVYVANCGSGICIIDPATDTLASTIATGAPSFGAAFGNAGTNAYVLCPSGLCVVNTGSVAVTATLPVGGSDIAAGRTRLSNLDHFKCYKAKTARGTAKFQHHTTTLADEFETKSTTVVKPVGICTSVDQDGEAIQDPTAHLECYKVKDVRGQTKFTSRSVASENQLGTETLTVTKAATLCVPTAAEGLSAPLNLDHFKCYTAKTTRGTAKFQKRAVTLTDEFETKNTTVVKPTTICNPVDEDGTGITTPLAHLECYKISDVKGQPKFTARDVAVQNTFGSESLAVQKPETLCVPSLSSAAP